jgi:hypothetical protein
MSKKTIIIAWRFKHKDNHCHDTVSFSDDYDIIKFYTPEIRKKLIDKSCFENLKQVISDINSDLFVFIHEPNFDGSYNGDNLKEKLISLSKPEKNIFIIPFSGGVEYIYEKLINQENNELKKIGQQNIAQIFEEIETKYGKTVRLNDKLNAALQFLHECLGGTLGKLETLTKRGFTDNDLGNLNSEGSISQLLNILGKENVDYIKELKNLRDTLLRVTGVDS